MFRERYNHSAIKGSTAYACFCWGTSDHYVGEEIKAPGDGEPSYYVPAPEVPAPVRNSGIGSSL